MQPSARTIIELNIKHFRKLLETEPDEGKRQTLIRLLADEEQKLVAYMKKRGEQR